MQDDQLWFTHPRFPSYEVNMSGEIRNRTTGRLKELSVRADGSLQVSVYSSTRGTRAVSAHRFIYEAVSGETLDRDCHIYHIDGDKQNNDYTNLEKGQPGSNLMQRHRDQRAHDEAVIDEVFRDYPYYE